MSKEELSEFYPKIHDLATIIGFMACFPENEMRGGNTVGEVRQSLCNLLNLPPTIFENTKAACDNVKNIPNNRNRAA